MEIIDDINRLLGDELKTTVGRGSQLRNAASTFFRSSDERGRPT